MQVLVFTVLIFLHLILSLGLKIRTFSKSTYAGLLKNVINLNPTWLWRQVMVVQTFCKCFFYSRFNTDLLNKLFNQWTRITKRCFTINKSIKTWSLMQEIVLVVWKLWGRDWINKLSKELPSIFTTADSYQITNKVHKPSIFLSLYSL